jgi:hypothetical protein
MVYVVCQIWGVAADLDSGIVNMQKSAVIQLLQTHMRMRKGGKHLQQDDESGKALAEEGDG